MRSESGSGEREGEGCASREAAEEALDTWTGEGLSRNELQRQARSSRC